MLSRLRRPHNAGVRIFLIAPPGAGKGTHGERIAERYGLPRLSSGEVFRAEVSRNTDRGRELHEHLERGDLVPDQLVVDMLSQPLKDAQATGGFVLDGFPRSVRQAEVAEAELGLGADAVIVFDAPEDVLVQRILARGQGRADDNEATIRRRFEVYAQQTAPLVEHYAQQGVLHRVDSTQAIDEVSAAVFAVLDPLAEG